MLEFERVDYRLFNYSDLGLVWAKHARCNEPMHEAQIWEMNSFAIFCVCMYNVVFSVKEKRGEKYDPKSRKIFHFLSQAFNTSLTDSSTFVFR